MSRQRDRLSLALLFFAGLVAWLGCSPTQPFYFHDDGDLSHYKEKATEIEYPDVDHCSLAEVQGALTPLTVENVAEQEKWDLHLEEAVQIALANSKVMRQLGGTLTQSPGPFLRTSDNLLRSPRTVPTIYDPAIVESGTGTSGEGIGVEAALAQFDAQFDASMTWEKNERPINVNNASSQFIFAREFQQDRGTFQAQISKATATGSQFTVRQNTVYDANNNPTRDVYSDWNVNFEAEARQPFLRGNGVQFNRIAGPFADQLAGGTLRPFNGVILARINFDVALADFEAGVRNVVSDVETNYWELYYAYRRFDAVRKGREAALGNWRKVHQLQINGGEGGEADKEAQARREYFRFRAQVESALKELLALENRLRFLLGLAATDGRLIRPADEPTTAKVDFDFCEIHAEGLTRSVELRREKWEVKRREMGLIAAKNFLLPRLDGIARYRWLGLGDDLISRRGTAIPGPDTDTDGPAPGGGPDLAHPLQGTDAFATLANGKYQEWQMGLELSFPIGFRRELATVRNHQLLLARERARLQDQELELSHQLTEAVRDLQTNYMLCQSNYNLWVASQTEVRAVEGAYDVGNVTFNVLLDAYAREADAESAYYRSIVDYNLSILEIHFRKGSLLENNSVYLAEGPWPCKAYVDAKKRARERDSGLFIDYGYTRPNVMSRGTIPQRTGTSNGVLFSEVGGVPSEAVPSPEPDAAGRDALEPPAPGAPEPGALEPGAGSDESPSDVRPEPGSDAEPAEPATPAEPEEPAGTETKIEGPSFEPARMPSLGPSKNSDVLPSPEATSDASGRRTARPVGFGFRRPSAGANTNGKISNGGTPNGGPRGNGAGWKPSLR